MRIAYVVATNARCGEYAEPTANVLAVCPDEATAQQYVETSCLECYFVPAPLMESSEPKMRGGDAS